MNSTPDQTAGVVAPPPLIYLTALALGLAAQFAAPMSILDDGLSLRFVIAAVLLVLSAAFARWAFIIMKKAGTSADPRKQSAALTVDGPFALSRNPIYVAMTGLYLGAALLANSTWLLVLLVPVLAVMHWGVIRREERYLTRQFGDAYLAYKAGTRRWL